MIENRQKRFKIVAAIFFVACLLILSSSKMVFAQALGVEDSFGGSTSTGFADAAGLAYSDSLPIVIAKLIRVVIGFLGIIAVIIILIGGFKFMTAAGADDKVKSAKKLMTNGVIGLVIILSSFAIASFIISSLVTATSGTISGSGSGGTGGGYNDGGTGTSGSFILNDVNTDCAYAIKNLQLQMTFSGRVSEDSVTAGGITVVKTSDPTNALAGTFDVRGTVVTFTPSGICTDSTGATIVGENCFEADTEYTLTLDDTILTNTSDTALDCSYIDFPCEFPFTTGSDVDTEGPTLTMASPDDDDPVYEGDIEELQSRAVDDTGVSTVEFSVEGDTFAVGLSNSSSGALATDNYFVTNSGDWDTSGYTTGEYYDISAEGADCAGHTDTSDTVTIILRAAHCNSGDQDADEEANLDGDGDCGGADCGACDGADCDSNDDCAGGYCEGDIGTNADGSTYVIDGVCTTTPEISEVSPGDGAVGNLVTIVGEGFGSDEGSVTFLGDETTEDDNITVDVYECPGSDNWSDEEIVIQLDSTLPDNSPIRVTIAGTDAYYDQTNDDNGPTISDFNINNIERPGICLLDPSASVGGNEDTSISGLNFGADQGTSTVYFGNYEPSEYNSGGWSSELLSVLIPLLDAGTYSTQVFAGDYVCATGAGVSTGVVCSSDGDCDETAGESCETNQCEDSGDYCDDDDDCDTATDEDCVSLRQGSNARTLTVTDPSAGETPIISQVDTGWELCSDTGLHCGDDADCGDFDLTTDDEQCEEADPTMGPPGQYVTIYGSNFGTSTGTVTFTSDDGLRYALGDLSDFPDVCADDLWDDTEITLKVPDEFQVSGSVVSAGTYTLVVTAGGVDSDGVDFEIVDDSPGPGICDIDPSGGPVEDSSGDPTSVTITGDNLGSSDGLIEFYDGQSTSVTSSWADQSVVVDVEALAQSGPVFATSEAGYDSNSMNFEVGDCNDGTITCDAASEVCCASGACSSSCDTVYGDAHYAWRFSTGNIPDAPSVLVYCGDADDDGQDDDGVSPGPWESWSDPSDICVNAGVTATFDMVMDATSLTTTDAVTVWECDGLDSSDPCANLDDSDSTNDGQVDGSVVDPPSETSFEWDPDDYFSASTTYRVILDASIIRAATSVGGEYMEDNYEWEFTTANSTELCDVGSVYVSPFEHTMTYEAEPANYSAQPLSADDECVPLQCLGYTWSWSSEDENIASVDPETTSTTSCSTVATAVSETSGIDITGGLNASLNSITLTTEDTGNLIINYTDPEVTSYEPSCDTACVNAAILVEFNTDMDESYFEASDAGTTVVVYTCEDSLCDEEEITEFVGYSINYPDDDATDSHALTISHPDTYLFAANTWYRVWISGTVRSESGVALSESGDNYSSDANEYYPTDFSWTFKTKDTATACAVDHITMNPESATAYLIGEQTMWEALPYGAPDDCSATGQLLDATDSSYDWSAWSALDTSSTNSTRDVAGIISYSSVTLSNDLEEGCSSECLHTGSTLNTDTAVCGDGDINLDFEECEDGDTTPIDGDGCSSECLLEGNSDSTTCGDGRWTTSLGEECDDSNNDDDDGCSSVCLNEGSSSVSATCGDGSSTDSSDIVDWSSARGGEDCDDGNRVSGDGCSSDCLHEGGESIADVVATCGNDVIEDGEDCDDDNADDDDGCSSECLNEGADACVYECYTTAWTGESCSSAADVTCSSGACTVRVEPCVGDFVTDYADAAILNAEDCDDGNTDDGDGCSSEGLNEGSSASYLGFESYCGDGDVETGEECEAISGADYDVENFGVSYIKSTAVLDVGDDGLASSTISITEDDSSVIGEGTLSLSCSCESDSQCNASGTTYGCGTSSCCFTRPTEDDLYPAENAEDVCLNTAIYVEFSQEMDESTFIATFDEDEDGTIDADELGNIHLQLVQVTGSSGLEDVTAATCSAAEYEQVAFADTPPSTWIGRAWNWIWQSVRSLFGSSATAVTTTTTTCLVPVDFSTSQTATGGMRVSVVLSDLLEADAKYRLVITEDGPMSDAGVLSVNTVGVYPSVTNSFFTTGDEICTLDEVVVEDLGEENALADTSGVLDESIGYFTDSGEIHSVTATSYTVRGGDLEEITPVTEYSWTWAWASPYDSVTESNVLTAALSSTSSATSPSEASATSTEVSGSETITATADVTSSIEDITASDVSGQLSMTSNICDNPWPPRDTTDSYTLPYSDSTSNFGFYYCRDAGDSGIADDLPELDAPIDVTTPYTTEIIQELIFKVDGEADAIGVRVLSNGSTATDAVSYLSAADWYTAQEFTGSPSDTTLDGYEAIQDGNTTYVAAANYNGTSIYPNIYAISYTEDASDESQEIFDQILANWTFNANDTVVTDVNLCKIDSSYPPDSDSELMECSWDGDCAETCEIAEGASIGSCSVSGLGLATDGTYTSVTCETDSDCLLYSGRTQTIICDAEKSKLTRDMKRLTDLQHMTALLTTYGEENGYCEVTTDQTCTEDSECPGDETCEPATPTMYSGTFVRALGVSTWPSWASVLGNELGEALPEDPINEFYQCTGTTYDGYESDSCWNPTAATFVCPDESHVYAYRGLGGAGYAMSIQLENDAAPWAYDFNPEGTIDTMYIETDYSGTVPEGFTISAELCDGDTHGDSSECGDGLIGEDETCEIGDTSSAYCARTEVYECVTPSPTVITCTGLEDTCTDTTYDTCAETSSGTFECTSLQTTSCTSFDNDSACASSKEVCGLIEETGVGTGIITTTCESNCSGFQTASDAETAGAECVSYDCGNGVVENAEECDDGSANGTYGHCGDDCTTDSAFSCGDGYLAGGEECDCGETDNFDALTDDGTSGDAYDISSWAYIFSASSGACEVSNGQYNAAASGSCSWDCQSPGPSCGDGAVNGSEACDGDYETWEGALCYGTTEEDVGEACTTDSDCDSDQCGSDTNADYQACTTGNICTSASDVGEECDSAGDCESASCGSDGECNEVSDAGTVCDDDADCSLDCSDSIYSLTRTRTCQTSCLWDTTYTTTGLSGGWTDCVTTTDYCGNGTVDGTEECDDGNSENTDACTNVCTENVCGDDYVYSGVESCDNGGENGATCDATYQGTCNYCTTNCQYMTSSGEYCGDGVVNGNEFCDGDDVPYYYVDFSAEDGTTSKNGTCDTIGGTDGEYTCRWLGVCDGGPNQGQECTLITSTTWDSTSYSDDKNGCVSSEGGTCIPPTCADDCNTMCPLSFETSSVLAMGEEVGASAEDSISLYSYLEDTTQDNAVLFIPACSVATQITADIDDSEVTPPNVAIMFVTDYTQTMERFPDGSIRCDVDGDGYGDADGDECTGTVEDGVTTCPTPNTSKLCQNEAPQDESRIDIISSATGDGISDLFEAFGEDTSTTQIGLITVYEGTDGSDIYEGFEIDVELGSSESTLLSMLDSYSTDSNLQSGPPIYPGLSHAISLVAASGADVQIVVLLSDGETTQDSRFVDCSYDLEDTDGDGFTDSTDGSGTVTSYPDTSTSYTCEGASSEIEEYESSTSPYTACAREVSLGLFEDDCSFSSVDYALRGSGTVKVYTAAITDSESRIANMAHMSSMDCGQVYYDADDCSVGEDGVTYAYSATTEDGINEMYSSIIDSILGVNFALTTESSDGSADVTSGSSPIGRDQSLPFPDGFTCSDEETEVPFTVTFNGTGAVTLSDITVTYCPAL